MKAEKKPVGTKAQIRAMREREHSVARERFKLLTKILSFASVNNAMMRAIILLYDSSVMKAYELVYP